MQTEDHAKTYHRITEWLELQNLDMPNHPTLCVWSKERGLEESITKLSYQAAIPLQKGLMEADQQAKDLQRGPFGDRHNIHICCSVQSTKNITDTKMYSSAPFCV